MKELADYQYQSSQSVKPSKMVIFLHGYGADGKDLISIASIWAESLPEDTVFYAPNAPEVCEMSPMGFQWFSLADRSPAAMDAGAKTAFPVLKHYIEQKCTTHNLSLSDVAIVGFSQGSMMALYTMPQLDEGCAGVMAYSGRLVGEDDIKNNIKSKFPICAMHGTADEVVPFDSLALIEEGFKAMDFDVKTHSSTGLGHGIDEKGIRIGLEFLRKILK